MKKIFLITLLIAGLSVSQLAEAKKDKTQKDTSTVKKGWTASLLPCLSASSNLGFQIGAFGHVYYHGDGSHYPQPIHDIGWEASWFTHGRTRAYVSYDSKFIIPNTRFNGSVTYVNDPMYNFYGFNGGGSYVYKDYTGTQDGMKREMVRVLADFQGKILPHFYWAAGMSYWGLWTTEMQGRFADKYLKGENDIETAQKRAMNNYIAYSEAGLIRENEKNGGHNLEFKAGLMYDSRDKEAAPNKGIWAEVYAYGAPDMFKSGYNYLKMAAHFRQYVTLPVHWKRDGGIVFAYHLAYQGTMAGEAPFYVQQNINTLILRQMISEGLGSGNSVRGLMGNRIIGNGVAWLNADLRIKTVSFTALKQFIYIGVCPFVDAGMVVQPYRMEEHFAFEKSRAWAIEGRELTREQYKKSVYTPAVNVGIGLKIGWNENFIASIEVAKCLNDVIPAMKTSALGNAVWFSIGVGYGF